jgi:hypothetical protein
MSDVSRAPSPPTNRPANRRHRGILVATVVLAVVSPAMDTAGSTAAPTPQAQALTPMASAQGGPFAIASLPVVFFPPLVPTLGGRLYDARLPGRYNGLNLAPPEGLADFVCESFYPALGTRLYRPGLSRTLQERLDAYRATRTTLVNALTEKLAILESVDVTTRASELAALAASQSPRILALEAEAEKLRDELVRGSLFQNSADWSAKRKWTLGVTKFPRPEITKAAEFHVTRAAAYFQKGLSVEQRGLLREIAMELQVTARAAVRRAPASRVDTVTANFDLAAIFFSPETARFILPADLPRELIVKIGAYNHDKAGLKQELRDAVFEEDKASSNRRTEVFEALADSQRPRLDALASLAEEIRRGFAVRPRPPPPAASPLPPELLTRIEVYEQDRTTLADELDERIRAIITPPIEAPASFTRAESRNWYERLESARSETRKRTTESFQNENRERYDELEQRYDAIYAELAAIAQTKTDPKTGRPLTPETLQRNHNAAMRQFEQLGREEVIYKNYRTASLLPGLSPEQRRLLFGAAVVGLAQALPPGEPMPSSSMMIPPF